MGPRRDVRRSRRDRDAARRGPRRGAARERDVRRRVRDVRRGRRADPVARRSEPDRDPPALRVVLDGGRVLRGVLTTARILDGHTGALTAAVALVGSVGWLFGIVPVLLLLLLLFPDGHLPSPRWRPVVWAIAVVGASVMLSTLFGTPTLSGSDEAVSMPNPWYSAAVERTVGWVAEASWTFIVIVALALAAIVVRFRRSRGVERQQMKWFAAAAVFVFAQLRDLRGHPRVRSGARGRRQRDLWRGVLRASGIGRRRGAPLPPLRPRRGRPQDVGLRGTRRLRHRGLRRGRRRSGMVARPGQLVPHDGGRRGRRARRSSRCGAG